MRSLPIESTDMLTGPILLEISNEPGRVIDLRTVIEYNDTAHDEALLLTFSAPDIGEVDEDGNLGPSGGPLGVFVTGESRRLALAYQKFHLQRSRTWLEALAAQQG